MRITIIFTIEDIGRKFLDWCFEEKTEDSVRWKEAKRKTKIS